MNWNELKEQAQLEKIKTLSGEKPVLIFKHSIRCSISAMALNRLERSWNEMEMANLTPYYLDLINNRDLSNQIANDFQIEHQSPQVLLIKNGKCIYHESHMGINYDELKKRS